MTEAKRAKPCGRLVDRYGREHSEAVLRNWSEKALKALGIRRVGTGECAEEVDDREGGASDR